MMKNIKDVIENRRKQLGLLIFEVQQAFVTTEAKDELILGIRLMYSETKKPYVRFIDSNGMIIDDEVEPLPEGMVLSKHRIEPYLNLHNFLVLWKYLEKYEIENMFTNLMQIDNAQCIEFRIEMSAICKTEIDSE